MITIKNILDKYSKKLDFLDLELIIARALGKNREFVLTHLEFSVAKNYKLKIMNYIKRRIDCEPLAYIFKEKEFYGMKFKVNKDVLIPRPETELIVELAINDIKNKVESEEIKNNLLIFDIGTGSGNIIISIAKELERYGLPVAGYKFYGTDISKKALKIANQNAKINKSDKKIKFLEGNLLNPIIRNSKLKIRNSNIIITANLPYLSRKIYNYCQQDIKKYEPKSALISQKGGLSHYEELFRQIKSLSIGHCLPAGEAGSSIDVFLEISPEQKSKMKKLVKKYFPKAKIIFHKDLSGRWRICQSVISGCG
ncbi:MAG: peptide chain release factor N(5)-glutamine methyltransferase [bacterium]|nr:peptide chain release factor N(5)-glutamine methyltransferase [bacterium]